MRNKMLTNIDGIIDQKACKVGTMPECMNSCRCLSTLHAPLCMSANELMSSNKVTIAGVRHFADLCHLLMAPPWTIRAEGTLHLFIDCNSRRAL